MIRDYNRDPNIKAIQRKGFHNPGSALEPIGQGMCPIPRHVTGPPSIRKVSAFTNEYWSPKESVI